MKRKAHDDAACSIARSLAQIGEWWSLLIIRDISMGKRRFSELAESLDIARNILSSRLKTLTGCGILVSRPAADDSRYWEYELTEKGRDLHVTLAALQQWGARWTHAEGQATYVQVDRTTGEEVEPLALRSRDGRLLGMEDLAIVRRDDDHRSKHNPV